MYSFCNSCPHFTTCVVTFVAFGYRLIAVPIDKESAGVFQCEMGLKEDIRDQYVLICKLCLKDDMEL